MERTLSSMASTRVAARTDTKKSEEPVPRQRLRPAPRWRVRAWVLEAAARRQPRRRRRRKRPSMTGCVSSNGQILCTTACRSACAKRVLSRWRSRGVSRQAARVAEAVAAAAGRPPLEQEARRVQTRIRTGTI